MSRVVDQAETIFEKNKIVLYIRTAITYIYIMRDEETRKSTQKGDRDMTEETFTKAAAAIGWEWKDGTIMDGFVKGRQIAILLDSPDGREVGRIAIVERKVRKGLRGTRVFPQLVEVWTGTVEQFLARA